MPPKRGKKAAPAKPALDGCKVALSGTFQLSQAQIKAKAEALGATVASTVTDDTTHLVATKPDYNKPSSKVAKAKSLGIHIVGLDWLLLSENHGRQPEKNHALEDAGNNNNNNNSNSAAQGAAPSTTSVQADTTVSNGARSRKRAPPSAADNAPDDEAAPKSKRTRSRKAPATKPDEEATDDVKMQDAKDTAKTESVEPKKRAKAKVVGDGQIAKSKDVKVPLDEACPFVGSQSVVYINDSGVIYDATLNQTNAYHNNNKFYRLQVIYDYNGVYHAWARWGRVGERGQTSFLASGFLEDAIKQFEKKFKDKSGLTWAQRGKNPIPGKYAFVERNYNEDSDEEEEEEGDEAKGGKASDRKPPECTLAQPVQELMQFIFNPAYFQATMSALNYDAAKLPLGKLSKATINRGFQVLKDLSALFIDQSLASDYGVPYNTAVEQLSNTFYSLIPHNFGRNRPPVIGNETILKRELELLESLSDMKDAASIMKMKDDKMHPLDKQYQELKMQEMTPLDPNSNEFAQLQSYLIDTRGATHAHRYTIEHIFRIERQGEHERFDNSVFGKMSQNRRLLWHGSRATNYGGILSQGLRIAPPEAPVSGYMFGKGIYLADMASKSANYCWSHMSDNTALLLLCEAELGDPMQELVNASYTAGEDAKEKGMVATWGQGRTGPSKWKDAGCVHPSLAGVMMPDTSVSPGPTNINSAYLQYNEYICYDVAQVRLRYLFRIKMG